MIQGFTDIASRLPASRDSRADRAESARCVAVSRGWIVKAFTVQHISRKARDNQIRVTIYRAPRDPCPMCPIASRARRGCGARS